MRLKQRSESTELYSIASAAHELGVSTETLRNLEKRGVLKPRRVKRPDPVRSARVYTEGDLQKVLSHYARVGGVRVLPKN
jgi:DNA-binding transcriptional MerR regulator